MTGIDQRQTLAQFDRGSGMDTKRLNNWLTLAANLGVIAGIVFLAFEIRQSNRIALVANETEIRKSYSEFAKEVFANRDSAELLARAANPGAEFDDVEMEMLSAHVFTLLNTWMAVEIAYDNGMLPLQTYNDAEDDIRAFTKHYPAMRAVLQAAIVDYPSGGDSDIYRIINEAIADSNP